MWSAIKWVFYTLIGIAGIYLAIMIGAFLAVIGAALTSLAIGGFVLLVIVLMVKEFFEDPPT